ncbi:MAG: hypothetical protein GYB67_02410 [Chloroflexi bacterium]|nr:hypothetical protein [Chloroflexota bacterium]
MQQINKLNELAQTVATLSSIVRRAQTYQFFLTRPATFYLDVEGAEVRLARHALPYIKVDVQLQMPFAWRLATDQDEYGVYIVARRRQVIGELGDAQFAVQVPHSTDVQLKLANVRLVFEEVSGAFALPPSAEPLQITAPGDPRPADASRPQLDS